VIAREKAAAAHLPHLRQVDDVTIETAEGFLMQTICLDGLLFETADTDEVNYRAQLRDAMLQAVGTPQFAIYHHVIRRKAEVALEARYPDAFSRDLDARWRERLASRQMYVNDLFLTIVRRPMRGQSRLLDRFRSLASRSIAGAAAEFANGKRSLHAASEAIMASLANYRPRLLSVRKFETGLRGPPARFPCRASAISSRELRPGCI
jgi:type IV secretion system protein VirB4